MIRYRSASAVLLGMLLLAAPVFAQRGVGELTGLITDPSGAVIPNATVTVINQATNESRSMTTDATGLYRIGNLLPGKYSVKATAQGFKTKETRDIEVTVGIVVRIDVKMEVGAVAETVTVEGAAPLVNTEQGKLSELVGEARITNMPLNGRNVYTLVQLVPGAVNVQGVNFENGAQTSVNGARVNFNGFMMDGVANKGLSGGFISQPNPDLVQEFRVDTNNVSAEFGNSAGAITQVVTKQGTNSYHGAVWEYFRNDKLDAARFFEHPEGKPPFRYNQFGFGLGGPIKRDKTFFFGSYEGQRTRAGSTSLYTVETPEWRNFVTTNFPNSVAALMYKTFPFKGSITPGSTKTRDDVIASSGFGLELPDYTNPAGDVGPTRAAAFSTLFGRLPANLPIYGTASLTGSTYALDNFVDGNQYSARVDHNLSQNDRIFGRWTYGDTQNPNVGDQGLNNRGFGSSNLTSSPNAVAGWTHVFSPNLINEFRAGYARSTFLQDAAVPGVPSLLFDDGNLGYGAYNGYPQLFYENIFNYQDLVSIKKGRHNIKTGFEYKRNQENSEFNVGRAAYYFFDPFFFAIDAPYGETAGIDPGRLTGVNSLPPALASNIRGWRNREWGAFVQDDWKIHPRLTLNLGLRWDLYERHKEKYNLATQFIFGPGNNITERLRNAGGPLAGVGGSVGGFAKAPVAGNTEGDHNNFGPRFGFAWDVFGQGRSAVRGGYGLSYESTFYNAISNSRWNPPFYSFNLLYNELAFGEDAIYYGPGAGQTPRFDGPAAVGNRLSGVGGNIMGYDPRNTQLLAFLTGIPNPHMKDPYVHSFFFGVEQQLWGQMALKVNYVGSAGHKLFRADNMNRMDRGRLFRALGDTSFSSTGRVNPNFGNLRIWQNSVNSNYHSLQTTLLKRMGKGLEFNVNYTWSKSIDEGSTWHSGATTSNGAAGGEGFSTSAGNVRLDRGPSIFDFRHRFTATWIYELPWLKSQQGVAGHIFGGWQVNGLITAQTGGPFSAYDGRGNRLTCRAGATLANAESFCSNAGGDYNLDGTANDRPNAPARTITANGNQDFIKGGWLCGIAIIFGTRCTGPSASDFGTPALGTNGTLGRNTFRGPGLFQLDFSLFKNIRVREGINVQFRSEFFNIFNNVNLLQLDGQPPNFANRINVPLFGRATQSFIARQIQFGLKVVF